MSATPPPTASKRAASPISPDTTSKRPREDNAEEAEVEEKGENEDQNGSGKKNENGNGTGTGTDEKVEEGKKMDDVTMDGADAGPSTTTNPPTSATSNTTSSINPPSSVPSAPVQAASDVPQQIAMRCLIVTQDASIIIGRGGTHVNEIREKSSARVTVSESIPGNPERILNVSGALDAVAKAFGLIVRRINDEPFDVASVPGSRAVTIKFIIPNSRMGSVIGKGGAKIKEIQEASGARLNASEAMLPGSTERVLSVSGVADAIHIAVYYIGTILLEYQERNPGSTSGSYRQAGARPGGPGDRGGPGPSYGGGGGGGGGGGSGPSSYGGGGPPGQAPGSQTQQIFIPNSLVGAIIGKGGQKINEIRQQSQCQIRVTEPGTSMTPGQTANPEERLVTITGMPGAINVAVQLLYSRLEAEKSKMQNNA